MSTESRQVLPFPDVELELAVVWGQRQVQIRDIHALALSLEETGQAVAELDDPAQGPLELRVGDVVIGQARLVQTQPARLEITQLFGQTGLVRSSRTGGTELNDSTPATSADK